MYGLMYDNESQLILFVVVMLWFILDVFMENFLETLYVAGFFYTI